MVVAKLSTGRIVQMLKPAQAVRFAAGRWVLVADKLTPRMRQIEPYWVPELTVVWVLEFETSI